MAKTSKVVYLFPNPFVSKFGNRKYIEDLKAGTTFELKKLFQGQEWETLTAGERKGFGRYFSNEAKDDRLNQVEAFQPDKKGSNKYIKR